jgi:hypothetical protein
MGRLMGIALLTRSPLPLDLPPLVWKKLVGDVVNVDDLRDVDYFCCQVCARARGVGVFVCVCAP